MPTRQADPFDGSLETKKAVKIALKGMLEESRLPFFNPTHRESPKWGLKFKGELVTNPFYGLFRLVAIVMIVLWIIGVMMNSADCGSGLSCP